MLYGHTLQAGSANKSDTAGVPIHIGGVFRRADWTAVGEKEDILSHLPGGLNDGLRARHCLIEGASRVGDASGAADGRSNVSDDGIGAGFGHFGGFVWSRHIDDSEQLHLPRQSDHLEFFP